jgi:serine/tyrosine/threonine adenylyltransferase
MLTDRYRPAPRLLNLPDGLSDAATPARFPQHILRLRNQRAAATVGLDTLDDAAWLAHMGRFEPLPDNLPEPRAMRYHGHQFRSYNPELGDGRGFTFAQLLGADGRLMDLGTKGSGQTRWSRGGDGRLTLKGGVREALATEFLEAQGVNTSKTLSLIETGERLQRHDEPSPTRGCALVRLSHGHIRFGTFQRVAAHRDADLMAALLSWSIQHYIIEVTPSGDTAADAVAFIKAVAARVTKMCAQWMVAGFVHGVLNTDNINITGESFDYGPWRFMPGYDPNFVAAYFDHSGLYRYGYQPAAIAWNLDRLADALALVAPRAALASALEGFEEVLWEEVVAGYVRRLGLVSRGHQADAELVGALIDFLGESRAPYQQVLHDWWGGAARTAQALESPAADYYDHELFPDVRQRLRRYEPAHPALMDDPAHAAREACDMLIDEVEAIWAPIAAEDDWSAFEAKIAQLRALRLHA